MSEKVQSWSKFYEDRINSTYQDYFENRYSVMIDIILQQKPDMVREEGIGIGSIAKALDKHGVFTYGFDNDLHMLGLCQRNNKGIFVYEDNILGPTYKDDGKDLWANLVVTHGVLEHFNDFQILDIVDRYRKQRVRRVHYVPLDKYETPSFGDERLMSYQKWLSLVKPKDYLVFNDGYDLLLID